MEENKLLNPKQQARNDFKNQMKMQMRQMGMPPPPNDPTEEELDAIIKTRINNAKESLKEKQLEINVVETFIARVGANRDVLTHVEMKKAETDWQKKAIKAEINELQAIIEEKKYNLEKEKSGINMIQNEIKKLEDLL